MSAANYSHRELGQPVFLHLLFTFHKAWTLWKGDRYALQTMLLEKKTVGRFQPTSWDKITIEKCTTSGGRTKEANERSFLHFVHHGRDDVTWKLAVVAGYYSKKLLQDSNSANFNRNKYFLTVKMCSILSILKKKGWQKWQYNAVKPCTVFPVRIVIK